MRRADLLEVTAGLVAFGLPRGWIRGLFRVLSRDGFWRELRRLAADYARERPAMTARIFNP